MLFSGDTYHFGLTDVKQKLTSNTISGKRTDSAGGQLTASYPTDSAALRCMHETITY